MCNVFAELESLIRTKLNEHGITASVVKVTPAPNPGSVTYGNTPASQTRREAVAEIDGVKVTSDCEWNETLRTDGLDSKKFVEKIISTLKAQRYP